MTKREKSLVWFAAMAALVHLSEPEQNALIRQVFEAMGPGGSWAELFPQKSSDARDMIHVNEEAIVRRQTKRRKRERRA